MIGMLLQHGDRVAVTIEKSAREHGYNPCPDGTEATVVGPTEITYGRTNNHTHEPGVYENRPWMRLTMSDGSTRVELSFRLSLVDEELSRARRAEWESAGRPLTGARLRDLPDAPFWEDDIVWVRGRARPYEHRARRDPRLSIIDQYVVSRVDYGRLGQTTERGTSYPTLDVSDGLSNGWNVSVAEGEAVLVQRGRIWKLAHGEPVTFPSLEEEARLAYLMGRFRDTPNPATGMFVWTLDETLAAIREGRAHGFTMDGGVGAVLFGTSTSTISVLRFRDEELGRRIAAATLAGFARE